MTKFYLSSLLATALLAFGGGNVQAQTDVTSTYLDNPSFELGTDGTAKSTGKGYFTPYKWTADNMPTSGTRNFGIFSANETDGKNGTSPSAFGAQVTPADGDYYFLGRNSWASSLTTTLSQETKTELPAGKYLLSVSYKIATKLTGANGNLTISAVENSSTLASAVSLTSEVPVNKDNVNLTSTFFNVVPWDKVACVFDVTEAGKVTINLAMNFNPKAVNTEQEAILIDDVRLYDLTASSDEGIDVSGLVTNQNFNLGITGWSTTTGAQNQQIAVNKEDAFNKPSYENWNGSAFTGIISQTVKNLPSGIYNVGISAFVSTVGDAGTQYVFAGDRKVNVTSTTPTAYTIKNVVVKDGTLDIGFNQTVATANWVGIDNIKLTYTYTNPDLLSDLLSAQSSLESTISEATAINSIYDNEDLSNAITAAQSTLETATTTSEVQSATTTLKAALPSTITVQNPSFEGGTSLVTTTESTPYQNNPDSWTNSVNWASDAWNYSTTSTDYYTDGTQSFKIRCNWASTAYSITQTLSNLPAGKYAVLADARATTVSGSSVKAGINGGTQVSVPIGAFNTITGVIDTKTGGDQTISLDMAYTVGTNSSEGIIYWDNVRVYTLQTYPVELDEAATTAPSEGTYAKVTYNRSFKQGWNSIVLPFDVTADELTNTLGASEAAEYKGTTTTNNTTTISFSKVAELKANVPYLLYFDEDKTVEAEFVDKNLAPAETTTSTGGDYEFVGTYTANPTISEGDYIVVSKGIQKAKGGNALKAFRAYLKKVSTSAKNMVLVIDDNVISTGINAVNAESVSDGNVYNVAGQKVSNSYKGLVIKNGKKYLNK